MFDPNLTLAEAERMIGYPAPEETHRSFLTKEHIESVRVIEQLRNECFQSRESYTRIFPLLKEKLPVAQKNSFSSGGMRFLQTNFARYVQGLPEQVVRHLHMKVWHPFSEAQINAATYSDAVEERISITRSGVLFVINQHSVAFPGELVKKIDATSKEMFSALLSEQNTAGILQKTYDSMRRCIGYNPPDIGIHNGLQLRGNGLGQVITNAFVRINFVNEGDGSQIIGVQNREQAQSALLLECGQRQHIGKVYGPSTPVNVEAIDALFARYTKL